MLDELHPVVQWARRELAPLLVERFHPRAAILFDPPDRPAAIGTNPPGLLLVAEAFRGVPVRERNALLRAALAAVSPVRPLCLTPEEFAVMEQAPGPVVAAARGGVRIV